MDNQSFTYYYDDGIIIPLRRAPTYNSHVTMMTVNGKTYKVRVSYKNVPPEVAAAKNSYIRNILFGVNR